MGIVDWNQLAIFNDLVVDAARVGSSEENYNQKKEYSLHLNILKYMAYDGILQSRCFSVDDDPAA